MGTRYIVTVTCPDCQFTDSDVYYAPTCDFIDWVCPKCCAVIDLAEYTGISYEEVSNTTEIQTLIADVINLAKASF